jgi:alcohol dehydrogenase (cytochrome c)
VLWKFQTGSGVVAPPVTWEQGGEQYVSVVSGWGGAVPLWGGEVAKKVNYLEQGGMVWVFKLPKGGGGGGGQTAEARAPVKKVSLSAATK